MCFLQKGSALYKLYICTIITGQIIENDNFNYFFPYTSCRMDKSFLKDCIAGKPKAQLRLYELYAPKMYAVCYRYAVDGYMAEEMMQEGFIKIYQNISVMEIYKRSVSGLTGSRTRNSPMRRVWYTIYL